MRRIRDQLRRAGSASSQVVAAVLCSVVFSTQRLLAQGIEGKVLEVETSTVLEGVTIEARLANQVVARTTTDQRGNFTLYLRAAGIYRLRATSLGYSDVSLDSISVQAQEMVEVTLRMARAPIPLAGITVESRRRDPRRDATYEGFYARRATARPVGTERVVLRDDPEMASASTVEAVLKWFLPARRCYDYYVDGRAVDPRFWAEVVMALPTQFLEGIEYYREDWMRPIGFEPPRRIVPDTAICTVVAVWRRRPGR